MWKELVATVDQGQFFKRRANNQYDDYDQGEEDDPYTDSNSLAWTDNSLNRYYLYQLSFAQQFPDGHRIYLILTTPTKPSGAAPSIFVYSNTFSVPHPTISIN
jgi:hypothetical protein